MFALKNIFFPFARLKRLLLVPLIICLSACSDSWTDTHIISTNLIPISMDKDLIKPFVTVFAPYNGQVDVNTSSSIEVTFSEGIKSESLLGNVTLCEVSYATGSPLPIVISYRAKVANIVPSPSSPLLYETYYEISLS